MSEWSFIIAAYAITWLVIIGYSARLVRLTRRAAELRADAERSSGGAQ